MWSPTVWLKAGHTESPTVRLNSEDICLSFSFWINRLTWCKVLGAGGIEPMPWSEQRNTTKFQGFAVLCDFLFSGKWDEDKFLLYAPSEIVGHFCQRELSMVRVFLSKYQSQSFLWMLITHQFAVLLFPCRRFTPHYRPPSPTSTLTGTWPTSPGGSWPPWCPRWTRRSTTSPTLSGNTDTTGTASSSTPLTTEPSRSRAAATGRYEVAR